MPTRDQLLALNDELRRLKSGGQRAVAVTEESLAQLRGAVAESRSGFMPDTETLDFALSGIPPSSRRRGTMAGQETPTYSYRSIQAN